MKNLLFAFNMLLNLQLFADAGTLVNATGNYVNAYDGTTQAFDSNNSMNGELKTFYDTELLENACWAPVQFIPRFERRGWLYR